MAYLKKLIIFANSPPLPHPPRFPTLVHQIRSQSNLSFWLHFNKEDQHTPKRRLPLRREHSL